VIFFSFAVERTAKENYSTASLEQKQFSIFYLGSSKSPMPGGLEDFSFSASQRKAKKDINLCVICASAVKKINASPLLMRFRGFRI
jgi:hypothetical protein